MSNFNESAMKELSERIEYESWLLEAIYEIADWRLNKTEIEIIYPPDGRSPIQNVSLFLNSIMFDWRQKFLEVGAPLVFVTVFKLLDMLIEWVLDQNGKTPSGRYFGYKEKIKVIKGDTILFPPLIENHPWLRERLIDFYEYLEPFRETIIHKRQFKTNKDVLRVSKENNGSMDEFTAEDLRNLAIAIVSTLRYLEEKCDMDIYQEKRLKHILDNLADIHKSPLIGQLSPILLTVKLYVPDADRIEFNVTRIKHDVAEKHKGKDVIFNVIIISIARDGFGADAYLIPWDQLEDASQFSKTKTELATYAVSLPEDVDPKSVALEMGLKL